MRPVFGEYYNFLVGENSTGKTSLLALLDILSEPRFWFIYDFATDEFELGTFQDIADISSLNKQLLRIGVIDSQGGDISAFLLSFKEKKGLPSLARYDYCSQDQSVSVIVTNEGLRYKIDHIQKGKSADIKYLISIFKKWISSQLQTIELKKVKNIYKHRRKVPIGLIKNLVNASEAEISNNKENSIDFGVPEFFKKFTWLAPVRSQPHRTYDQLRIDFSPEGEHTPYLVKAILGQRKNGKKFQDFIKRFGKESNLFDSILVRNFGRNTSSPFCLNVLLNGKQRNVKNVGYGVSQSLPVIVEMFARTKDTWFAIQQPEIHLHPKAQAAIGDIFYELAVEDNKKFLVETHSDYIIDRFRLNFRKSKNPPQSQVLFFERKNGKNIVHPIQIENNGQYSTKQPKSFRNFFIKEELNLLMLE